MSNALPTVHRSQSRAARRLERVACFAPVVITIAMIVTSYVSPFVAIYLPTPKSARVEYLTWVSGGGICFARLENGGYSIRFPFASHDWDDGVHSRIGKIRTAFYPFLDSLRSVSSPTSFFVYDNSQELTILGTRCSALAIIFPLYVILLPAGALPVGFYVWRWRRDDRGRAGYCAACGYDLRGSRGPNCPECGAATVLPDAAVKL